MRLLDKMMNKESVILVTGAGGVLGYGILNALEENGYSNVYAPSRKEMDALEPKSVSDYFKKVKPDFVFHLASLVYGLKGNLDNQFKSLTNNTLINQNIITACKEYSVKKIFFAGTVASYAFPYKSMPLKEDDFLSGPPHEGEYGYAMAKRHALSYLHVLKKYHDIDFCYALFTNIYGPNDRFDTVNGHVIPSLIQKAFDALSTTEKKLNVWGNAETTRDFLFNLDAGRYALAAMNNYSGILNIASGDETSMGDIVRAINLSFDNVLTIEWDPAGPVGISKRSIDTEKLKGIGVKCTSNLDDDIRHTIEWYKDNTTEIRK
jgi:GDP-L-fucose synthase